MMIRRRRPLLRAAMIGGVGYAGYRAGRDAEARTQHEYEQDARLAEMEQEADVPPVAPLPRSRTETYDTLVRLKGLLDSGALTQEEYDAEKARLLRSG